VSTRAIAISALDRIKDFAVKVDDVLAHAFRKPGTKNGFANGVVNRVDGNTHHAVVCRRCYVAMEYHPACGSVLQRAL
jgi:hypothetical protein